MIQDKIEKYFNRNANLHILFFFEADGFHEEEIKQLQLKDIRVVEFTGQWFNLKIKFCKEWKDEKVFLYLRQPSPQTQEDFLNFPLLDLLKANSELKLGDIADFMEEFGLKPHQHKLVDTYILELQKSQVQQVVQPLLTTSTFEEKALKQGLIAAFLELNKIENWDIILVRLLSYSMENKQKNLMKALNRIVKIGLLDDLNNQIRLAFNCTITGNDSEEITDLVRRLKYNSIVQNLVVSPADPYEKLKIKDSNCIAHLNRIRETGLNHPTFGKAFAEVLDVNGKSILDNKLVEIYGSEADYVYMPEALKWEIIGHILKIEELTPAEAEKSLQRLYIQTQEEGTIKEILLFLLYSAAMFSKINEAGTLILDKPEEYLQQYTNNYSNIDMYYRKSIELYHQLDTNNIPVEEQLEEIKKKIERSYSRFSFQLNNEWLKCIEAKGFEYKNIECDKQYDFFNNKIAPLQKKVAVIISDALRYEVAQELLSELHKDEKNVSTLSFQLASLPSETSFGMSNLLPGNVFTYDGEISIDGEKPVNVEQRDKILKKRSERCSAVSYDTILNSSKQENRELFKADVVYIYHDIIDKEGHKGTERNVFLAAKTAITELAKLVKLIHGGFNVTKVIVTSDHGFLYNDSEIEEADKNEMEDSDIIESGARHYITNNHQDITIGYKIPLYKVSRYQEPWYVVIPDSVNRFKKPGSRYKFTHGGGSLQELVVPIIESARKEERIQRKVKATLLSKNLSIVSNNLKFQLIQEKPISATEKECSLEIGIYDGSTLVSNIGSLTLNSTGELPTERAFTVRIALNTKVTASVLKLKIFDKEDLLNPLIEESVKNNTLIERDF